MNCGTYAQPFLDSIKQGRLMNRDATSNCGYCQYDSGVEFLRTLHIEPEDKWRYFGIFLAFCISNWALVYFFIYTVRICGWSFGFGYIFSLAGNGLFKREGKKEVTSEA
jgi:ATP-binding cassette, subfamily G (WHITE), member 2, SNQ2